MSQDNVPGQGGYPGQSQAGYGQPGYQQQSPGQYWQPPAPGHPPAPGYPRPAQQWGQPSDENVWALCAYLTTLVASFIGPLVVYLIKKDESPFIRRHAAQSLNMVITAAIYGVAAFVLIIGVAFGLFVSKAAVAGFVILVVAYVALAIVHLIYLILASVKAGQHQDYQVPAWLAFRLVR